MAARSAENPKPVVHVRLLLAGRARFRCGRCLQVREARRSLQGACRRGLLGGGQHHLLPLLAVPGRL